MLFGEISQTLLQSAKPKASVGELNFYFAVGWDFMVNTEG
jgi:hypothetical protein